MTSASQLQTRARLAAVFTLTLAFAACSDGDAGPSGEASAGNAGASATGGKAGSGGESTSAGTTSGGVGTSGSGGKSSTAGSAGTNAQAGSGGNSGGSGGTGNHAGTSGMTGAPGEAGASGAPALPGDGGASGLSAEGGASGMSADAGAGGDGPTTPVFVNNVGSGADGDLDVDAAVDLSTANSVSRTCADGGDAVSYAVTDLGSSSATLAAVPSAGCLAVGDEVLLINLQGTGENTVNVGNYETLKVSALDGGAVTFSKAKTRFYGDAADNDTNLGVERTNQRVMLQRVPNYHNVTVTAAGSLSAGAWDGVKGGVLFFRAAGQVTIAGSLSMSGKGYVGGVQNTVVNTNGQQGESIDGLGTNVQTGRQGAGGGGIGDGHGCESFGSPAAGAGYATSGSDGPTPCSGVAGSAYGEATLLTRLLLGSGGGAGGTDDVLSDNPPGGFGGRGGGIVVIAAAHLQVTGTLVSAGLEGQGDVAPECDNGSSVSSCWDFSGPGGGGSGGSILLDAGESSLGNELVTASGGFGGIGQNVGDAGDGADGRIAVHALTLTGTTLPTATID